METIFIWIVYGLAVIGLSAIVALISACLGLRSVEVDDESEFL